MAHRRLVLGRWSGLRSLPFVIALTLAPATGASEAAGVGHDLLRRDELQLAVLVQGSGSTIVILPSLGRSGEDRYTRAAALARAGFRILRPQPRGIGNSHEPMDGLTLHDLAADVAVAIEAEHAAPVLVVGHAHGSFVARQLATDRPDLVKGVVIAAGSAGKVPPGSSE